MRIHASVVLALALSLISCAKEGPTLERLTAHFSKEGVTLAPPSGIAAQPIGEVMGMMNDSSKSTGLSLALLSTEHGVMVTIYRFAYEKDAQRFFPVVEKLKEKRLTRDPKATVENVRHGNFVLVLSTRAGEDVADQAAVLAALKTFPLK